MIDDNDMVAKTIELATTSGNAERGKAIRSTASHGKGTARQVKAEHCNAGEGNATKGNARKGKAVTSGGCICYLGRMVCTQTLLDCQCHGINNSD